MQFLHISNHDFISYFLKCINILLNDSYFYNLKYAIFAYYEKIAEIS